MEINFEVDIQELEQEKQELKQELLLLANETNGLFDAIRTLDATWKSPSKEEFLIKIGQACQMFQSQIEESRQVADCMEYAGKRYEEMEQRACNYIGCIAWEE